MSEGCLGSLQSQARKGEREEGLHHPNLSGRTRRRTRERVLGVQPMMSVPPGRKEGRRLHLQLPSGQNVET